jgi:transcriptional regulator with XRE-family HTH domain
MVMSEMLGSYLKRIRKERGLTLRDVEAKTEISNAYLSQLENQKITNPSPQILHKLADCYNVSYERLMELTGYPVPEKEIPEPVFRKESGFENLTKEEKESVMEYIHFLRSRRMKR